MIALHSFRKTLYAIFFCCCAIFQGRSETPSNQTFEGVKFMTIVKASDISGKFFDVKIFILENVTPQVPLSVIYQISASYFGQQDYATENMHLLGIYAVVNQVTLRPKEIIHTFVTLVSTFCRGSI